MGKGSSLEALVIASQGRDVILTQVPQASRRIRGGNIVAVRGPVDFFGLHIPTGRSLVFDAKESSLKHRFNAQPEHLPEHQRLNLIRYGEAGAVAGLLIESTANQRLFWLHWAALKRRVPSYPWDDPDMHDIGDSRFAIKWDNVVGAATQAKGATV